MWMMRIFTTDSSSVPKWVGTFRRNKDNTSTACCFFFSAVSWESVTCFLLFRFVHFFIFLVGGEVVSSRTSGPLTKWCTPADNKRGRWRRSSSHTHSRTHSTNPFVIYYFIFFSFFFLPKWGGRKLPFPVFCYCWYDEKRHEEIKESKSF